MAFGKGKPPKHHVELTELVDYVADQLLQAEERAGKREKHVMRFVECELEMAVAIESEGSAGVRVYVLELAGGRKKTDSHTIRVKFASLPGKSMTFLAEDEPEGPELGPGEHK